MISTVALAVLDSAQAFSAAGTNVPSSIGQAVSHGCLRIDNGLVAELAALLPLGTPVMIS